MYMSIIDLFNILVKKKKQENTYLICCKTAMLIGFSLADLFMLWKWQKKTDLQIMKLLN